MIGWVILRLELFNEFLGIMSFLAPINLVLSLFVIHVNEQKVINSLILDLLVCRPLP